MSSAVIKSHRIRLNLTVEQENYFWQAAGIARYSFNWGLAEYNSRLDYNTEIYLGKIQGEKVIVNGRLLRKEFGQIKPSWISDVTCWAHIGAFEDLQKAFSNYFSKKKKGLLKQPKDWKGRKDKRPVGWPKFKSKHCTTPSFYLHNGNLKFNDHLFMFDKGRVGWINMTECLRFDGRVIAGRVSYRSSYWWLSVQVEVDHEVPQNINGSVGVDLGIKYLAVTSDGQIFDNPKPYVKAQKKLRRLQRKLDRQRRANNSQNYNEDGTPKKDCKDWHKSQNMIKTDQQISQLHFRIANIRQEESHKMTTELAENYGVIGIEDLNINGMKKNRRIAKAISDAALYEKRRQFEYKAKWNGSITVPIDRWFPSSKTCNECGWINADLTLADRYWICKGCGVNHHRDGNAAINIRDEALRILNGGRITQRTPEAL